MLIRTGYLGALVWGLIKKVKIKKIKKESSSNFFILSETSILALRRKP